MRALLINEAVIPVRFHEVDQMTVVHHSHYYVYMEIARFQFARNVLGVTHDDFVNWRIQVPVRRCACEYLWPARFGDTVVVQVKIQPTETASLHLKYTLSRESDGRLLARGETVNVFLNLEGKLIIRTPAVLQERISRAMREYPDILVGSDR